MEKYGNVLINIFFYILLTETSLNSVSGIKVCFPNHLKANKLFLSLLELPMMWRSKGCAYVVRVSQEVVRSEHSWFFLSRDSNIILLLAKVPGTTWKEIRFFLNFFFLQSILIYSKELESHWIFPVVQLLGENLTSVILEKYPFLGKVWRQSNWPNCYRPVIL